jgi:hypothetical protein
MKFIMYRTSSKNKYYYKVEGNSNLKGEAKCALRFLRREVKVYDKANRVTYELSKPDKLKGFIWALLPFVVWSVYPHYSYCENNEVFGTSITPLSEGALFFKIKENIYEIRQHSNFYVSIMKADIQMALIMMGHSSDCEMRSYEVQYSPALEKDFVLLFLLCIFVDVRFYLNKGREIGYHHILFDKYKDRVFWKPNK